MAGLGDLIRTILRYRWAAIGCLVLCIGLAVVVAVISPPIYKAEVLMAPVPEGESQTGLQAIASELGALSPFGGLGLSADNDETEQALAILESRAFTQGFIRDRELLPVLFPSRYRENGADTPSMSEAYELFDREIRRIERREESGLVTLQIFWRDREKAAEWANELVARLNEHLRTRDAEEAIQTMAFLEAELEKTNIVEVRQGVYQLIENQVKRLMLTNVRKEYAFEIIDPATVPDPDDFERPRRAMLIGLGTVAGFFLAILLPLFLAGLRQLRDSLRA